jgi:soluble lytic murein transglycosylase-like protein
MRRKRKFDPSLIALRFQGVGGGTDAQQGKNTAGYEPGVKGGAVGTVHDAGSPAPVTDTNLPEQQAPALPGVPSTARGGSGRSSQPNRSRPRRTRSTPNPLADHYLLQSISDLLTPGPTAKETAESAIRLGVKPKGSSVLEQVGDAVDKTAENFGQIAKAAGREAEKIAKAPQKAANTKVHDVLGRKTLGTPTVAQLLRSAAQGKTRVNKRGRITIPETRQAAQGLAQARRRFQATARPDLSGLSPEERAVVPLALKAHKQFPDVPVSVLMAQIKQESGFNPAAVSSADAQGLSQFIPSTAAEYDVKYGTGRKEQQSQVTGEAHYLHNLGFGSDPQAALTSYSGGYAAGDYNNPILSDAQASYGALDRPTKPNPKAAAQLKKAEVNAQNLGIPVDVGSAQKQLGPPPPVVVSRFKAGLVAASELDKLHLPYVLGGGHNPGQVQVGSGVDCSGAVSFVLQKMGVKLPGGVVSGDMGNYLQAGPGAVTVYYNGEHTFMKIGNKFFGTSHANPEGGAGFIPTSYEQGEAESGKYAVAHVPGLGKKVALQMGIDLTEGATSGGGVVYGPGGTTATVTGAAPVDSPGFSNKPVAPPAALSSSPIETSPLLATGAALPTAFQQFQQGVTAPEEGPGELGGLIASILKRRRA